MCEKPHKFRLFKPQLNVLKISTRYTIYKKSIQWQDTTHKKKGESNDKSMKTALNVKKYQILSKQPKN